MYDTTLDAEAKRRIRNIGWADIVVGIPSHRNGRTIGEVVDAVVRGVTAYLPEQRVVFINSDGGSSDNTLRHLQEASVPPNVHKLMTVYKGSTGKGTAIRSILETAALLGAKACAILEARAPGIVPEWIPLLVDPVLRGQDLAWACYKRNPYDSALTDNLVYPFLHMFMKTNLREPLAPEFCVSGQLAADLAGRDVWETDVARFGINVWVAMQALAADLRMVQVDLGYRGESSGEPGDPTDARFLHTVGTLFRLLTVHRRLWMSEAEPRNIPFLRPRELDDRVGERDCAETLELAMGQGYERHGEEWEKALSEGILAKVMALLHRGHEEFDFSAELWAATVLEAAVIYNEGEGDPDKVVEALLPLFYGRAAAYVRESHGLTLREREANVGEICRAFEEARPAFMANWEHRHSWEDDMSRFWLT